MPSCSCSVRVLCPACVTRYEKLINCFPSKKIINFQHCIFLVRFHVKIVVNSGSRANWWFRTIVNSFQILLVLKLSSYQTNPTHENMKSTITNVNFLNVDASSEARAMFNQLSIFQHVNVLSTIFVQFEQLQWTL